MTRISIAPASRNFISIAITRFNYNQTCLRNDRHSLFNHIQKPIQSDVLSHRLSGHF